MPWCPICKNEYVEGMTVCADCGCELVDSLEDTDVDPAGESGIEEEACEWEDVIEGMPQYGKTPCSVGEQEGVYEDSAKKAEEFKSGAYTLLFVGILGLAVLAALISGVLPVRLNPFSQWMTCLVMGALFLIFIVMGALSFKSSRRLAAEAVKEGSLKDEMKAFCKEKMNADALDEEAQVLASDSGEMRYFKRAEQMKLMLSAAFPDAKNDYLDYFVDEAYQEIFGE